MRGLGSFDIWRAGWFRPLVVAFVGAVCYLAFLPGLGFYFDDWMIIRGIDIQGAGGIFNLFHLTRPIMAYNSALLYAINGLDPLHWHLTGFVLRLAAAFIFFWGLTALFPRRRMFILGAAIIFLVYPGFSRQPISVIFSGLWICLIFITFSLSATTRAATAASRGKTIALSILAAVSALYTYLLYEAFLGLELHQIFLLFLILFARRAEGDTSAGRDGLTARSCAGSRPPFYYSWTCAGWEAKKLLPGSRC